MEDGTKSEESAPSVFDQLRAVARHVDREMAALRRGRRDPVAFVQHDPTETLLALRSEIDGLRRGAQAAAEAESAATAALHDLAAATADFTERRRVDLAAITAYLVQYGYEPPPPPPPAESPAGEAAEQPVAEPEPAPAGAESRPAAAQLDTPEEVQLSDITMHMLRGRTPGGTSSRPRALPSSGRPARERAVDSWRAPRVPLSPAGQLPSTEDDTGDATALLNFRQIPIPLHQRASPAPRGLPPPPGEDAVLVTPGLWVKRRSTLLRPPPSKENRPLLTVTPEEPTPRAATPSSALSGYRHGFPARRPVGSAVKPAAETVPVPPAREPPAQRGGARAGVSADDSLQSPELSEETRAMLARRKFGKV